MHFCCFQIYLSLTVQADVNFAPIELRTVQATDGLLGIASVKEPNGTKTLGATVLPFNHIGAINVATGLEVVLEPIPLRSVAQIAHVQLFSIAIAAVISAVIPRAVFLQVNRPTIQLLLVQLSQSPRRILFVGILDNAASLRSAIRPRQDIGTGNGPGPSHKVLEILPAGLVR